MHHHHPDPVVHPYPINRDNQMSDKNTQSFDDANGQTDCPTLSDEYDMEVGLAGALQ